VDERREQRVEDAHRGESDADNIDGESAGKICEYDATASARHADGLGNVQQIVANEEDVGALTRDVGPAAHRDSDCGAGQRDALRCGVSARCDGGACFTRTPMALFVRHD
jgi:hypothetical protein